MAKNAISYPSAPRLISFVFSSRILCMTAYQSINLNTKSLQCYECLMLRVQRALNVFRC